MYKTYSAPITAILLLLLLCSCSNGSELTQDNGIPESIAADVTVESTASTPAAQTEIVSDTNRNKEITSALTKHEEAQSTELMESTQLTQPTETSAAESQEEEYIAGSSQGSYGNADEKNADFGFFSDIKEYGNYLVSIAVDPQTYTGYSIAHDNIEYCEDISTEHELFFKGIKPGADTVVISEISGEDLIITSYSISIADDLSLKIHLLSSTGDGYDDGIMPLFDEMDIVLY